MPRFSDQELETILQAGEADRSERKRNADDLDRIREAVCAFANDLPDHRQPGVVFVGIEDDGSNSNLAIDDKLLQRLGQIKDDGTITPFPTIEVRRATLNGSMAAVVVAEPSANPPVRVRGRVWIRVGPRRAIATAEEEKRLIEKRRWANLPFDAQPVVGSTIDDLDLARFETEYLPSLVSQDTIAQNKRDVGQQLQALRLTGPDGTPTTTAILMLGKSTQDWLPAAHISWRRVGGTGLTDETQDEKTLTGTLPDQLRRIDDIMDAANATGVRMGSSTHSRIPDYPLAALQQLVRNAVMHRTYEGTASPVRVTRYTDRVEILSPGGTYGAVTPEVFGSPGITDYRNPTLSEALKGYGFVERFGQGIEIARTALKKNGNPPLKFTFEPAEAPAWVHVIIGKPL